MIQYLNFPIKVCVRIIFVLNKAKKIEILLDTGTVHVVLSCICILGIFIFLFFKSHLWIFILISLC